MNYLLNNLEEEVVVEVKDLMLLVMGMLALRLLDFLQSVSKSFVDSPKEETVVSRS